MGAFGVVGGAEVRMLVDRINQIRSERRLQPLRLFSGTHSLQPVTEQHVVGVVGKWRRRGDGAFERQTMMRESGFDKYQEREGQLPFNGILECIRTIVGMSRKSVNDPSLTHVWAVIGKKGLTYTWLIAFMAQRGGGLSGVSRHNSEIF